MAEQKTKQNTDDVNKFLNGIADARHRSDCLRVLELMKAATGKEPAMWGKRIVGFGRYQYKYDTGTKGEWFLVGLSPRKQDLSLYIMSGLERYDALLKTLGKHKTGKCCLYIKKLEDVDVNVLDQLIKQAVVDIRAMKK